MSSGSIRNRLTRTGFTVLARRREIGPGGTRQHASGGETGTGSLGLVERILGEVQMALPGSCRRALEARQVQSAQGWRTNHSSPSVEVSAAFDGGERVRLRGFKGDGERVILRKRF